MLGYAGRLDLDFTVYQTFGKGNKKGEIGIEIEAEGKLFSGDEVFDSVNWRLVEEGSLRGGWEFVLRNPLPLAKVEEALDEFTKLSTRWKFQPSLRTSLHVHVNVYDYTLREIYNILGAFWIVETLLVKANGKDREGNLFCLRSGDAEEFVFTTLSELEGGNYFDLTGSNQKRYSSINVSALKKFGSLEFRFMKGMYEKSEILLWTRELYSFVTVARKLDLSEFLLSLDKKSPFEILKTFFSIHFARGLLETTTTREAKDLLFEGYCYSYRLLQALKLKRPPEIYPVNEDLYDPTEEKPVQKEKKIKLKISPGFAAGDEIHPWDAPPIFPYDEEGNLI